VSSRHKSDNEPDEAAGNDAEVCDADDADEEVAAHDGHEALPGSTTESGGDGVQALGRSQRKPVREITWWERNPKAYVAAGPKGRAPPGWHLTKAPANSKKAPARSIWALWKVAEKEEYLANETLDTWSQTRSSNKCKAVKAQYLYDIKHDSKVNITRYKARMVPQGFNQVPGCDFDETRAPVPSSATTRAHSAVAAAKVWEEHHVDVKTAYLNEKMDKEMYIMLPVGAEPAEGHDIRRLILALYGTKQA